MINFESIGKDGNLETQAFTKINGEELQSLFRRDRDQSNSSQDTLIPLSKEMLTSELTMLYNIEINNPIGTYIPSSSLEHITSGDLKVVPIIAMDFSLANLTFG